MPPSANRETKHPTAYRHTKRREWGLATLAWERDGKRGFKFEDGTERAFPIEFCHLLEEVEGAVVVPTTQAAAAESSIAIAFEDQVSLLLEQFPGGFQDPAWQSEHRGAGRKRPLKRHRDGTVEAARKLLGQEPLAAMIEAKDWVGVRDAAAKVAGSTDLVSKSHADSMTDARPSEGFATSLYQLLHPEIPRDEHFDEFCRALASTGARASSWPLATVFGALVVPERHLCVRARVLQRQGELLRIPGQAGSPTARGYRWALNMAERVRDELVAAEVPPKDFLDVYDFGWLTLRPAAGPDLARLAGVRLTEATDSAGGDDDDGSTEAA